MGVALVAHIKDHPVRPGVKHPVNGHNQFHRAQAGGQVPAGAGYHVNEACPQQGARLNRLAVTQGA